MSDKSIEIRMAVTGADQAAAEVRKPVDAVQDLNLQTDNLARKNAEALVRREEQLRSFLQAADGVKKFGQAIQEAGPELDKTFGTETAGKVRAFGQGLENLATTADLAAKGFAAGGPLGAAIGALVGVALPELKAAMDDMVLSLQAQNQSAANAEAVQLQLNRAYSMGTDAYIDAIEAAQNYKQATDDLTDSLESQARTLQNRNRLLDAQDSLNSSARDNQDAAAIRAGADPEDVKSQRARDDAEVAKAKIARDIAEKFAQSQAAADKLAQAERSIEAIQNDPTARDPEQRQKALDAAKAAREKAQDTFDKSRSDFEGARDVAGTRTQQIDVIAAGKIEALQAEKARRELQELDAEQRRKERRENERERIESQQQKDAAARARADGGDGISTAGLGLEAAREARGLGNQRGAAMLESKARQLMQNPSKSGSDELLNLMERFVDWAENNGGAKDEGRIASLEKKILTLEARMKNSRTKK